MCAYFPYRNSTLFASTIDSINGRHCTDLVVWPKWLFCSTAVIEKEPDWLVTGRYTASVVFSCKTLNNCESLETLRDDEKDFVTNEEKETLNQSTDKSLGCTELIFLRMNLISLQTFFSFRAESTSRQCPIGSLENKHLQGKSLYSQLTDTFILFCFLIFLDLNKPFHIGISSGINSASRAPQLPVLTLGCSRLAHQKTAFQLDCAQSCRRRGRGGGRGAGGGPGLCRAYLPVGTRFALEANDVCATVGVMLS